jgi:transposase
MRSLGVDIHKDYIYVFELGKDGTSKHLKIALHDDEMTEFLQSLDQDTQVVVEASTNSFRFCEIAARHAGRVIACDPAHTRGVVSSAAMNDHKAAEALARLLQTGFIREVWVPPASIRALRCQVAHYMQLSRMRVQAVNRIRSLFQQEFIDFRSATIGPRVHPFMDAQFREQPELRFYLCSWLRLVNHLSSELAELERFFGSWCKHSEEAELLMTIPGVGVVLSTVLLAQIGDIRRFSRPEKLCSYAGLVPRVYESGRVLKYGGISRAGRSEMRWALHIAILRVSGRSKTLDEFKQKLRDKRPKMVAQTAACRKLLTIIWSMLTHKRPFREQDVELNARKKMRLAGGRGPSPESLDIPKMKDERPSKQV